MRLTARPHYPYPGNVRALTQDQIGQLLAELRRSAPPDIALIAWTQYEVAGRIREVLHLRPDHVQAEGVYVERLKNSNPSHVRVSKELLDVLRRRATMQEGGSSAYLFSGGSHCPRIRNCKGRHIGADTVFLHVQKAGRAIGLDPGLCKTHVLRHSAITHVAELCGQEPLNVTLGRLATFSGHKNLEHLLHYLSNPREESKFRVVQAESFGKVAAPKAGDEASDRILAWRRGIG